MTAPYRKLLETIRIAFPKLVSDRVHDSYSSAVSTFHAKTGIPFAAMAAVA